MYGFISGITEKIEGFDGRSIVQMEETDKGRREIHVDDIVDYA